MGPVNTQLIERAVEIFSELGYTIDGGGPEFSAERGWKRIRVSAVEHADEAPRTGTEYHCFVVASDRARTVKRQLRRIDPEYEWAVIGVDGDDYEVERAPRPTVTA